MGFFFDEDKEPPPAAPRARAASKQKVADPNARGCDHCPMRKNWSQLASPKLPSVASRNPEIMVLGEMPSKEEDHKGRLGEGSASRLLMQCIPGRDAGRIIFSNAVRCHVIGERGATRDELHACSIYLEEELAKYPTVHTILGLGQGPLSQVYPGAGITRVHGLRMSAVIGNKRYWYYPVIAPNMVTNHRHGKSPYEPILRADMRQFFRTVDNWGKPPAYQLNAADVIIARNEQDFIHLETMLDETVGFDIETNDLVPYKKGSKIISAALSDGATTFAFAIDHPEQRNDWAFERLVKALKKRRWIAHNADFELKWMLWMAKAAGLEFEPGRFEDTMAQQRLITQRESVLGLDDASFMHLGIDIKSLTQVNARNILAYPLSEMLPYNGLDALASLLIFKQLNGKVDAWNYEHTLETIQSVVGMELLGLPIDLNKTAELSAKWQAQEKAALASSARIYEVREFERRKQQEFNIASNDDVGVALVEYGRVKLPRTKGGKSYITDDATMKEHAGEDHPLVMAVLAYREASKMHSTYILPFFEAADIFVDGLLHPQYTTMRTATGRLSSANPNIQNFPKRRHKDVREQVVPLPGHVLVSFDYKQLEARVIGMASKDALLCKSIIAEEDIHQYWLERSLKLYPEYIDRLADKTNQTELKLIMKGGRDVIKTDFVFASFFGSSADSCSARTGIPLDITEEMASEFWSKYGGVKGWIDKQRKYYSETGSIETLTKRVRHGALSGNEPINTPIQGTAADIVRAAQNDIAALSRELKDPYFHPRINIHDDLTFMLPQSAHLEEYIQVIGDELVKVRFDWQVVPLSVEAELAEVDWAHKEGIAVFTGAYVK